MKNLSLVVLILIAGGCNLHQVAPTTQSTVAWDKIYVYYSMPEHARVLGTVYANANNGSGLENVPTSPPNTAEVLNKLKMAAAKLGANGVVVHPTDENYLSSAELDGKAIIVSP